MNQGTRRVASVQFGAGHMLNNCFIQCSYNRYRSHTELLFHGHHTLHHIQTIETKIAHKLAINCQLQRSKLKKKYMTDMQTLSLDEMVATCQMDVFVIITKVMVHVLLYIPSLGQYDQSTWAHWGHAAQFPVGWIRGRGTWCGQVPSWEHS